MIERRGTGGGAFRLMYSRFLAEAGYAEASLAADAAAAWTDLAAAFRAASEQRRAADSASGAISTPRPTA